MDVDLANRTVTAEVDVKNTGDVAGKDVVQLYTSVPYTDYDVENKVEKSAVQLLDYEKTDQRDCQQAEHGNTGENALRAGNNGDFKVHNGQDGNHGRNAERHRDGHACDQHNDQQDQDDQPGNKSNVHCVFLLILPLSGALIVVYSVLNIIDLATDSVEEHSSTSAE